MARFCKIVSGKLPCTNWQTRSTVALLPWGDLIEDFLDSIGVSFESFCQEMTGGWLFGYIDALRTVGIRTVVFCISARVEKTTRYTHVPTGATICVLPASGIYLSIRRRMVNPHAWTLQDMFGQVRGIRRWFYTMLKPLAPYLSTPPMTLAREMRREGCTLILCQEYEYARFDICVALGKLLGIPVFATFQGGDQQFSRVEGLVRPITLKHSAGLIVGAQTEIQRIYTKYREPSILILHIFNPIDLSSWPPLNRKETRKALEIPDAAQVVVWHGRVDIRRKGLDILLDAWKRICEQRQGRHLLLLLIGTGDDADELQRRITTMRLQNVLWVNKYVLDRAVIRGYLAAADVYVFPSRHEGFPVAPIEAMASGLPVVTADAPGISDIFEGGEAAGGIVVPCGDSAALALALGSALDNPTWCRQLGRNSRQRVVNGFSLEAVGKQLYTFFQRKKNCPRNSKNE
jgi:glycosyltransferase involved in cell wall biosynthesis